MRRAAFCLAMVSTVILAGCGDPETQKVPQSTDLLFLRSSQGISVLEAGSEAPPRFSSGASVTSSDWSTVVKTRVRDGVTTATALDPSSGAERWRTQVAGALQAKLLSEDGDLVALSPLRERYYQQGRRETTLVMAGSGMIEPRSIVLEGNYEPEAFSTDGESLFVINYLPARRPTKYQVRRMDVDTGRVRGVYTPHDELQRPMGGTARIQVASPDGRRLYTLYTVGGNDGYAFIHVLALDEMWAHCISLPPEFAEQAEAATALTVSPDGDTLFVANSAADRVAEIDTENLNVARTGDVDLERGGPTQAAHDSDETFYFAGGHNLTSVNTSDLVEQRHWRLEERVSGIQLSASGSSVYVGMKREVAVFDADTGDRLDTIDPPGVGRIDQLGAGLRSLDSGITKCAC